MTPTPDPALAAQLMEVQSRVKFQEKLVSGDAGGKDFCLIIKFGNGQVREFDLTRVPGYVPGLSEVA